MWRFSPFITSQDPCPQVRHDKRVALAWALKQCAILLEASPGILCCHSPGPLQVSHASYWEGWPVRCLHVGGWRGRNWQLPQSLHRRLDYKVRNQSLRRSRATVLHTPDWCEEASEPERDIILGVMAIAWRQLPLTPQGISALLAFESGPPPLKDIDSPVSVPQGAQLDLISLGSMQIVVTQNTLKGELQYHYQTRVISWTSLHLTPPDYPDQSNTNWELRNHEQVNQS